MKSKFLQISRAVLFVVGLSPAIAQLYTPSGTVATSSNGNVGIGVPSPVYTLDINGPGTRIMNGNGNSAQLDLVQTNGGHDWALVSWGAVAGGGTLSNKFSIYDGTSGGHRFLIDSNGNVGIGTTSPAGLLEIKKSSPTLYITDNGTSYAQFALRNSVSSFYIGQENAAGAAMLGGSAPYAGIINMANANPLQFGTSNLVRMTIGPTGNIGIGTTVPDKPLHLSSDSPSSPALKIGSGTDAQGWYSFFGNDTAGATISYLGNAYNNDSAQFQIRMKGTGIDAAKVTVLGSGNVGIGTTNPTQKLSVNGTIRAKEVVVETSGWSDYVFAENYVLQPLADVEAQIKQNKHLPGIPSAQQVAESGIGLGEMQAKLLAKIEELTLHQIEQEKRIHALEAENAKLRK